MKIVVMAVVVSISYFLASHFAGIYPHQLAMVMPLIQGDTTILTIAEGVTYALPTKIFYVMLFWFGTMALGIASILGYVWYAIRAIRSWFKYRAKVARGEVVV